MSSEPRCYYTAYMILAVGIVVGLLGFSRESGEAAFEALCVAPPLIMRGEVWRLATYTFLAGGDPFFTLLYKFFVYVFFAAAVEAIWGTRRFLMLYLFSVLGGGLAALLLGQTLSGGGIPEVVAFLVYGLLFPDRRIYLFLAFPFRARTLVLFLSGAYVLNAFAGGVYGMPLVAGFGCGAAYFYVVSGPAVRVKRTRDQPGTDAPDPATVISGVPTKQLEEQARRIVNRRMDRDAVTQGERLLVEELIQRVDPRKELCSADPARGEEGMCPICRELGVCLRRFLESKATDSPSKEH